MQMLGLSLMKHLDPLAQPNIHVPPGKKLHKTVAKAKGTVIYSNQDIEYRVLTPRAVKFEDGATFRVLIVRGPKPSRRATARIFVVFDEDGLELSHIALPAADDWLETDCGSVIYGYEREIAAYDAAARAAYYAAVASRGRQAAPNASASAT